MNNETKISQSIQAHKLQAEARKNAETAFFYNVLIRGVKGLLQPFCDHFKTRGGAFLKNMHFADKLDFSVNIELILKVFSC